MFRKNKGSFIKSGKFRLGLGLFLFACCGLSYLSGSQSREQRATETYIAKFTQVVLAVSQQAVGTMTAAAAETEEPTVALTETPIPLPTDTPSNVPPTATAQVQIAVIVTNTLVPPTIPVSTATSQPPTIPPSTNTPVPPTAAPAQTFYVGVRANVRDCPQTSCNLVRELTSGNTVQVVGQEQGESVSNSTLWYILDDGNYVHSSVVSSTAPVSAQQAGGGSTSSGGGTITTVPPQTGSAPCDCHSGNTMNCTTHFTLQSQAQACMNYCESLGLGDVHGLDGNDDDGLACESLP